MATAVYLRLRDGRSLRFGRARDAVGAAKVKAGVEQWISDGITLSVANARGEIEDVTPLSVQAVEMTEEPTPKGGSETWSR